MFNPLLVVAILGGYMLVLVALAAWVEKRGPRASALADSRWVYVLALGVYCTSWTFYGSVGVAAHSGFLFLAIYLGPTLVWLLGWTLIRRLARFKAAHHVSNLGDLLAARYGRTAGLPALATILAVVAINPYIALQLKAVLTTFHLMVDDGLARYLPHAVSVVEVLVLLFVMAITIVFGLRHLDPTQRQRGLMVVLAAQSVVKLLAFLGVGLFVTYGLHDGLGDIFLRLSTHPASVGMHHDGNLQWYFTFLNWLLLSMGAILFLPRQFHVTIIELPRLAHLRTAMWAFPLYLLAINFFVYPIAGAGLLLGHPANTADTFVLTLPLAHGNHWLALLVFIGGFSSAVGMIMVAAMALSVMVANNLVMPLAEHFPSFSPLRRRGLAIRWAAASGIILAGYLFERGVGDSYFLVAMGLISFAGVLQFAPAVLGGLFWRQASRSGAFWGLAAGFILWAYTLFLPAMAKSGWLSPSLLLDGPFGLTMLRPEALFGVTGMQPLAHGVFWSLLGNIVLFVAGSCWRPATAAEQQVVAEPMEGHSGWQSTISGQGAKVVALNDKIAKLRDTLGQYLPAEQALAIINDGLGKLSLLGSRHISHLELTRLLGEVETSLAGAIGTASAHAVMHQSGLVSPDEAKEIARLYSKILANLNLTPEELRQRVDYYQERDEIMNQHASELSEKVEKLKAEIAARAQAEGALRESEKRFRSMADSAPVQIWISEKEGDRSYFNQAWLAFTGRSLAQELRRGWLDGMAPEDRPTWESELAAATASGRGYSIEYRLRRHDGKYRWIAERAAPRLSAAGTVLGFIGSCLDISDMKAAAEALRRSRDELEALVGERTAELTGANAALTSEIEQRRKIEVSLQLTQYSVDRATDSVFWVGTDARILYANDAACRSLGYTREELLGLRIFDFDTNFAPAQWAAHWQTIKSQGAITIESMHRARDGRLFPVEIAVNYLEFAGREYHFAFVRDISQRKRDEASLLASYSELKQINEKLAEAQNQLLQSEKMASIGQLAAGVAHEINNPIGFVSSNLGTLHNYVDELLKLQESYEKLEGNPNDPELLEAVRQQRATADLDFLRQDIPVLMRETADGVQRVRQIVKDLKDFSHVDEAEWQESDLHACLDSTLNVVWNELKYKAKVVKEYGELPLVSCIPSQLNQVFMNLLVNAAQAISGQGTITIRTGSADDRVWVEVADTGQGIAPEHLKRIFDPFFTTKPVGKGTGLGLSVSYGIIKKHGGQIDVSSEPGHGTRFRVWMPIARQPETGAVLA
ncbi:MAG: PAS domain S-box protein [Dechloromonas sp.]|nr:PAS domain S-box protein [Dechloromonas sp.]